MEELYLEYLIENKYETPVRKANYQLLVIPESNSQQQVFDLKLVCTSEKEMHISTNFLGFEIISIYLDKPFVEFSFKLSARIQKSEFNPFQVSPLDISQELEIINTMDFQIDNHLFLTSTDLTKMPVASNIAFPKYDGNQMIFDYLVELNNFIYQFLEYSPESTDINTPIEEVLKIRKGVCQDYAHLLVSVCRQNKIPARYVSGYLNQGTDYLGSSQLHAWAEVLIPELGWIGFDSTNNLLVNQHYIKIAHGTDYRDCSPIIGVLESTGAQKSIHSVTVSNQ